MRIETVIPFVLAALVAAYSVSRLLPAGRRHADPMSHEDDAKRRIKEIYLRARRRIAELRKERRRIVDDFARKADAVRAAKVKKDIETL